jgi:HNH endonuclease
VRVAVVSSDEYTLRALRDGRIKVDEDGAVFDAAGRRAEHVTRGGSGRVLVSSRPKVWAPAHRVVYLATHGSIPERAVVRHRNGMAWDNAPGNLYASGQRGFVTYAIGE